MLDFLIFDQKIIFTREPDSSFIFPGIYLLNTIYLLLP